MPKGKKKGKFEHRRTEQPYSSDEDAGIDMTIDNESETSGQSDLKSNHEDAENEIQEKLEEKVVEIMEGLSARSNAARAGALVALRGALQRRALTTLLAAHRATLADHLARALRKGRDAEKRAAAAVTPLVALQIGEEGTEEFVKEVRPALTAGCVDMSASIETRAECCSSLAVLCYLLDDDITEILEVMRMYEGIFSGSYLKGDGSARVGGAEGGAGALHAAALDGWALLLALLPEELARAAPHRLPDLLEAPALEVRMAAGCALAALHESAGEGGADELAERVLPRLDELARDSHKYRAKRDRKLQRATFRDVLKYFEEDEIPSESFRIGAESVTCDTWAARAAYSSLAATLGAGLQTLAPHAPALRHALGLARALPLPARRLNKLQRHLQNSAACKARTISRNKSRDKRSAALAV